MAYEVIQPTTVDDTAEEVNSLQEQDVTNTIFEELQKGRRSSERMVAQSRDIALLRHGLDGSDVAATQWETFQVLKGGVDGEKEKQRLQEQYIIQSDKAILDMIRNTATSSDPDVRQATADLMTGREEFISSQVERAMSYDGGARTIKELYAGETTEDFVIRRQTMASAAQEEVHKWADQFGLAGKTGDFIATAFAPDDWKDRSDLIGKGQFSTENGLAEFIQEYQDLDPEEQAVIFPELLPKIIEAYDQNTFDVSSVVAMMHDRDYAGAIALEDVGTALTVAFLPGDIWAAGKLVKGLASLTKRGTKEAPADLESMKANPTQQTDVPSSVQAINGTGRQQSVPHQMMQINNEKAAAETMTISGLDPKSGKFMGVHPMDAASTAWPFRIGELPIVNGAIDTISEQMVRQHRAHIVEYSTARRMEELRLAREGDVAERAGANRRMITLPRRIERLKKDIKVMARNLPKMKARKGEAAQAEAKVLENALSISVQKLAVVKARLAHAKEVVEGAKVIDRLDGELIELASGRVPNTLASHMQAAVAQRAQEALHAEQRAPKVATAKADYVAAQGAHTGPEGMDVLTTTQLGTVAGRVLDDPLRYGLSEEMAANLRQSTQGPMAKLIEETEELSIEKFTAARKEEIQQRVTNKIISEAKAAGKEVKVAEIVNTGEDSFRVLYRTDDVEQVFEYEYKLNDAGTFEGVGLVDDSLKNHLGKLLSPSTMFHDLGRFVNNLTFAGDQAAKIGRRLQDMHSSIHRGLTQADKAELESLLATGDELGRVFHIDELEAGIVETAQSIKPQNANTIRAYYRMRAFYDEMHDMRDYFTRKELNFAGYKDISYTNKEGKTIHILGRPMDDLRGQDLTDQRMIFVPGDEKEYMSMSTVMKNADVWKQQGYKYVELREPHEFLKNGKVDETIRFAMIADDFGAKIGVLPKKVLNYQPGYLPRIYGKGYTFVKNYANPGRPVTAFATETKADAIKFADQLNAFSEGAAKYVVKEDRELSAAERAIMDADSFGGLYTGARANRELLVRTTDGAYRPKRVSNGEATARYMSNLASLMPLAEYRLSLMRQWANTVDMLAEKEGRIGLLNKTDFSSQIDLSPDKKALMESARDYLKDQLKLQSDDEKFLNRTLLKMSDALYVNDPSKARSLTRAMVQGMIDKDPVQQLKGLTFNLQLGMFNPRQLIVQVQNAAIAASISPQHAPGALADSLAMRAFVLGSENSMPGLIKATAKATGRSEQELTDLAEGFRKTGLWDSIKRDADFDADTVNMSSGTLAALRKTASAGRVFFREGELMARLMSYNIARRRLGPTATPQELFDEHLRLSMNMQSANAAVWQKNALGVPLQYMQVFTKFYENLIPGLLFGKGKWTRKEAASVLAGQVTLYGTIGVPVAEDAYAYLADSMGLTPTQAREQYPWVEKMMDQGATGVMSQMLGFENNFSESLSILGGTSDTIMVEAAKAIYDGVTTGGSDLDFSRVLAGPSSSALTRTADAGRSIVLAAQLLAETPTLEMLGDQSLEVLDEVAAMASSWSNARKVIYLHDIGLVSRQSNSMFHGTSFSETNLQSLMAKAMGFELDIETAYWELKDVNRTNRQNSKDDLAAVKQAHLQYMKGGSAVAYKSKLAHYRQGKTPAEWKQIQDSVMKGLTGDSDFDRQAESFFQHYILSGGRERLEPATSHFGDR